MIRALPWTWGDGSDTPAVTLALAQWVWTGQGRPLRVFPQRQRPATGEFGHTETDDPNTDTRDR